MLTGLFFAVSGYLLGSILFASIISKLFHKDIISKSPDKNYGTANAFRYGGVLCGALTLLCDMGKGFLRKGYCGHIRLSCGYVAQLDYRTDIVLLLYSVYDADKDNPSLLLHYYHLLLYNACIVLYRVCEGSVDRYAYDNYCLLDKDAQCSRRT